MIEFCIKYDVIVSTYIKYYLKTGCICKENICFGRNATIAATKKYDGFYSIR